MSSATNILTPNSDDVRESACSRRLCLSVILSIGAALISLVQISPALAKICPVGSNQDIRYCGADEDLVAGTQKDAGNRLKWNASEFYIAHAQPPAEGAATGAEADIDVTVLQCEAGALLNPPAVGERVVVKREPGKSCCFNLPDIEGSKVELEGNTLKITLAGGGEIVLENFIPSAPGVLPSAMCLADGSVIEVADLILRSGATMADVTPPSGEIAPAAGSVRRRPKLTAGRVSLRAPLWPGETEKPLHGLYSYLLFGSDSDAGHSKRLAAARAYLKIPSMSDPSITLENAPLPERNLFYVPLCTTARKSVDISSRDAQWASADAKWLLAHYDYFRARLLLSKLDLEGDGIYLVSYLKGLAKPWQLDRRRLVVWDLSLSSEDLIETWILEFRRQLRQRRYWETNYLRKLMLELRSALPLVANLIKVTHGAIAGKLSPDRPRPQLLSQGPIPGTKRCGA